MKEKKKYEEDYVEKKTVKRRAFDYLLMTAATFIYAVGVSLFIDPNNLAPGGITGISIIINRISGIETGTLIFLLNIPIILIGFWKFGWRFMLSTFYCVFLIFTSKCYNAATVRSPEFSTTIL